MCTHVKRSHTTSRHRPQINLTWCSGKRATSPTTRTRRRQEWCGEADHKNSEIAKDGTGAVPVKRHRGEPEFTRLHRPAGTDGHTDHTDEPHNHPNPTTVPVGCCCHDKSNEKNKQVPMPVSHRVTMPSHFPMSHAAILSRRHPLQIPPPQFRGGPVNV
jgi:hypothetical protein